MTAGVIAAVALRAIARRVAMTVVRAGMVAAPAVMVLPVAVVVVRRVATVARKVAADLVVIVVIAARVALTTVAR